MLLIMVPGDSKWFSVVDLKDAFFIPVDEQAQSLFPFEWQDPETKAMLQQCRTVLLQGFKTSLTIFRETLEKDSKEYPEISSSFTIRR